MKFKNPGIQYRRAEIYEILELRAAELRSGKSLDEARFTGDELSTTLHFGAFKGNDTICCLTLLKQKTSNMPAWQLRGMATEKSWQKKGVGRSLLQFAEDYLLNLYPEVKIWCNAREIALQFYTHLGYVVISDPFIINGIGKHYKMEKILM